MNYTNVFVYRFVLRGKSAVNNYFEKLYTHAVNKFNKAGMQRRHLMILALVSYTCAYISVFYRTILPSI